MIDVMILDDHQMFIDGVKAFLSNEKEINLIADAENGEAALEILKDKQPHVLLLDVHMPKMDGEEILKRIRKKHPKIKIIAVTMSEQEKDIRRMLENGANGYILKSDSKDYLINAIHQVYAGKTYVPLKLAMKVLPKPKENKISLTEREQQVLDLLKKGLTDKEIGKELEIANKTVEVHQRNMRKKMDVGNRVQLLIYANEHGL